MLIFQVKKEGTHLKVFINSNSNHLLNKSKVLQHKAIYSALKQYMNNPIHALSLKINTNNQFPNLLTVLSQSHIQAE